MNTIHIIDSLRVGGVEVGVLNLIFHNKDYTVLAVNGASKELLSSIPNEYKKNIIICDNILHAIITLIKLKPKIIISSLWRAHFTSIIFKIIKKKTKRIHFTHNARFAHIFDKLISKTSIRYANNIFNDSEKSSLWIKKYNIKKIPSSVIPMNISFSSEKRVFCPNELSFVYAGRLSKVKRLDLAIHFIHELVKKDLKVSFHIFGPDSGELNNLIKLISELKLQNIIFIRPALSPFMMEKKLREYNFYLQTSEVEGMAISVFQAIKNGLLPLVTPVGEISGYTRQNINAIYFNKDNIQNTASSFQKLYLKSFQNFKPGEIINPEHYPTFAENYFQKLREI